MTGSALQEIGLLLAYGGAAGVLVVLAVSFFTNPHDPWE